MRAWWLCRWYHLPTESSTAQPGRVTARARRGALLLELQLRAQAAAAPCCVQRQPLLQHCSAAYGWVEPAECCSHVAHGAGVPTSPPCRRRPAPAAEERFFQKLEAEVEKCGSFTARLVGELRERLKQLQGRVRAGADEALRAQLLEVSRPPAASCCHAQQCTLGRTGCTDILGLRSMPSCLPRAVQGCAAPRPEPFCCER